MKIVEITATAWDGDGREDVEWARNVRDAKVGANDPRIHVSIERGEDVSGSDPIMARVTAFVPLNQSTVAVEKELRDEMLRRLVDEAARLARHWTAAAAEWRENLLPE